MRAERFLPLISALAAGIAVLAATLMATGHDPIVALGAMWRGAFGSWDTILLGRTSRSIPLIVIGLASAWPSGPVRSTSVPKASSTRAIAATWAGLTERVARSSGYRCPADHFDPGRRLMVAVPCCSASASACWR